jgi:hypothetical protein
MSLDKVIPKLISIIRIRVSIRELDIIDTFAIMLDAEIEIFTVDEKLWKIVKLWD